MKIKRFNQLNESVTHCPECSAEIEYDDVLGIWKCKECEWQGHLGGGLTEKDKEILAGAIDNEGFGYAFIDYSNFDEIKDAEFHRLRKAFKKAAKELKEYIGDIDEYL